MKIRKAHTYMTKLIVAFSQFCERASKPIS